MSITVVLTNWKRTRNMRRIVKQLRSQTARPRISIWNNGGKFFLPKPDWGITSSLNTITWARWLMASMSDTEYVAVMDDDLCFTDTKVLEDAMKFLKDSPDNAMIGPTGVNVYNPNVTYKECPRVYSTKLLDQKADMILGRLVVVRTEALKHVRLIPGRNRDVLLSDDIIISAQLANGIRQFHSVPSLFCGRIMDLPSPHASCSAPDHYPLRDQSRRRFFKLDALDVPSSGR